MNFKNYINAIVFNALFKIFVLINFFMKNEDDLHGGQKYSFRKITIIICFPICFHFAIQNQIIK